MSHDITRDSFDRKGRKGYAKVRRQQGRMFTDSDFNEQVDLDDRRLRDFIHGLLGASHAGPIGQVGFEIGVLTGGSPSQSTIKDLTINEGYYYVDGIRVHNPSLLNYLKQPGIDQVENHPFAIPPEANQALLVYLDVRSVPVTPLDDADLLDVGFGGRDSSNRDKWDWIVRVGLVKRPDEQEQQHIGDVKEVTFVPPGSGPRQGKLFGKLAFAIESADLGADHCVIAPDEPYTGPENQLYRVEVHRTGKVTKPDGDETPAPRFKWSRDNAAPAFAIETAERDASAAKYSKEWPVWRVTLTSLDALGGLRSLETEHWVEVYRPYWYRKDTPLPLLWVRAIDPDKKAATLTLGPSRPKELTDEQVKKATDEVDEALVKSEAGAKGRLVLWDHQGGDFNGLKFEADVRPAPQDHDPTVPGIHLEHGILAKLEANMFYRAGEYWLDLARTASAAPSEAGFVDPSGPEHVYAPLALIFSPTGSAAPTASDRRKQFGKLAVEVPHPPAAGTSVSS